MRVFETRWYPVVYHHVPYRQTSRESEALYMTSLTSDSEEEQFIDGGCRDHNERLYYIKHHSNHAKWKRVKDILMVMRGVTDPSRLETLSERLKVVSGEKRYRIKKKSPDNLTDTTRVHCEHPSQNRNVYHKARRHTQNTRRSNTRMRGSWKHSSSSSKLCEQNESYVPVPIPVPTDAMQVLEQLKSLCSYSAWDRPIRAISFS